MEAILAFRNLTKAYGSRTVLKGITLELAAGQILGYFGLNGAGKSTTNRIALGFARPTSGEGTLFGYPTGDPRALARAGYLPENPFYYEYLTGRELLDYAARLHRLRGCIRGAKIDAAADRVRLAGEALDRPIRTYSRGMRQRLGLAQALVGDPAFLLLDEPFSGLDPVGRAMLKDLLREFRAGGGTVFFSSHQLLDAAEVCDRAAILHRGVLAADEPLAQLMARHPGKTLEQIFLAQVGQDAASDRD
ncbi:MAG: ABC transporter ATP-binding protein [Candidatus Wallbacteria bacterium]|nr:ABC transporter ATP-binding protein [Candidatus Wallbacteria bacterium]